MIVNIPVACLGLFYGAFVVISSLRFFKLLFHPDKTKIAIFYYAGFVLFSMARVVTFALMLFIPIVNKERFFLFVTIPEMLYLCEFLILIWHFLTNYITARINISDDLEIFSNEDVPKIHKITNDVIYVLLPIYLITFVILSVLNYIDKLNNKELSSAISGFNFLTSAIAIGYYIFLLINLSGRPYKDDNSKKINNSIFLVLIIWIITRIISGTIELIVYQNYSVTFIYDSLMKNDNLKNTIMFLSYFIVTEFIPLYSGLDKSFYNTFISNSSNDTNNTSISNNEPLISDDSGVSNKKNSFDDKSKFLLNIKDLQLKDDESLTKKNGLGKIIFGKYKNNDVICREITFDRLSRYDLEGILNDLDLIYNLSNDNIAPIIGLCLDESNKVIIVYPYYSNGTLYELIHEKKVKLSNNDKIKILINIANGIKYLNSNQIYHCHLSSKNIILNDKEIPIITDYGFDNLREIASIFNKYINKNGYTCPELLSDNKTIGHKLDNHPNDNYDIYSFGLLIWEIFEEKIPFNVKLNELIKIVVNDKCRPEITNKSNKNISELIRLCWDSDPLKRPKIDYIINELNKLIL